MNKDENHSGDQTTTRYDEANKYIVCETRVNEQLITYYATSSQA
jgi:hypothetical protein